MSKNLYKKTAYGVGFIGEGNYKVSVKRVYTHQYIFWRTMLRRCYSSNFHNQSLTYKNCTVSSEWHNFQNFAKWFDENYYEIDGERMNLDKDILVKGNKVYSPDTCIFVPSIINNLFVKSDAARGMYPIGVSLSKESTKKPFRVLCSEGKRNQIYLGRFSTPEEGFRAYKVFKERVIKKFANEYKDKIPSRLYESMINYEVEITD